MAGRASGPGWLHLGVLLALLAAPVLAADRAGAETAWVKDELRLNLRTGPGTGFRITGVIETGDAVQVLSHGDGWTQIRAPEMEDGWIPAGYLQGEPPARIGLAKREEEATALRERLEVLGEEASQLRSQNETFAAQEATRSVEMARLKRENVAFRAGARWPEWFTGAGILMAGMVLGGVMSRSTGRRRVSRVRL